MKKLVLTALAMVWPVTANAEPIYLNCTVPFQQRDGGRIERHFEVSVDAAEQTGNAREIDPPYQLGGGRPTSPIFEPDSVTFILASFGGVTEGITVSRVDLSIYFLLGSGGASLRPASLKGQCQKAEAPERVF